ncbi:MAG TPA: hypothetical protein VE134_06750 [Methanomicrobiales archaeon]|nr:hypothetical protein [Methanomicrobiales archaeon]
MDYYELAELADKVLEISGDDEAVLAGVLERLPHDEREELLLSDFLNAYQVFYFYFREAPTEMGRERLILTPASLLPRGVLVEEVNECQVLFILEDLTPIVTVSDGEEELVRFEGESAYRGALRYIEESL